MTSLNTLNEITQAFRSQINNRASGTDNDTDELLICSHPVIAATIVEAINRHTQDTISPIESNGKLCQPLT